MNKLSSRLALFLAGTLISGLSLMAGGQSQVQMNKKIAPVKKVQKVKDQKTTKKDTDTKKVKTTKSKTKKAL